MGSQSTIEFLHGSHGLLDGQLHKLARLQQKIGSTWKKTWTDFDNHGNIWNIMEISCYKKMIRSHLNNHGHLFFNIWKLPGPVRHHPLSHGCSILNCSILQQIMRWKIHWPSSWRWYGKIPAKRFEVVLGHPRTTELRSWWVILYSQAPRGIKTEVVVVRLPFTRWIAVVCLVGKPHSMGWRTSGRCISGTLIKANAAKDETIRSQWWFPQPVFLCLRCRSFSWHKGVNIFHHETLAFQTCPKNPCLLGIWLSHPPFVPWMWYGYPQMEFLRSWLYQWISMNRGMVCFPHILKLQLMSTLYIGLKIGYPLVCHHVLPHVWTKMYIHYKLVFYCLHLHPCSWVC